MMIFNDEYINVKYDRFDLVSILSTKEHAFILEYKENLNSFLVYNMTTNTKETVSIRNVERIGGLAELMINAIENDSVKA